MANFSYKRTETTTLKAVGVFDAKRLVIDIDGEEKSLSTLLSDFDGAPIEINIKIRNEEDLTTPAPPTDTE